MQGVRWKKPKAKNNLTQQTTKGPTEGKLSNTASSNRTSVLKHAGLEWSKPTSSAVIASLLDSTAKVLWIPRVIQDASNEQLNAWEHGRKRNRSVPSATEDYVPRQKLLIPAKKSPTLGTSQTRTVQRVQDMKMTANASHQEELWSMDAGCKKNVLLQNLCSCRTMKDRFHEKIDLPKMSLWNYWTSLHLMQIESSSNCVTTKLQHKCFTRVLTSSLRIVLNSSTSRMTKRLAARWGLRPGGVDKQTDLAKAQ